MSAITEFFGTAPNHSPKPVSYRPEGYTRNPAYDDWYWKSAHLKHFNEAPPPEWVFDPTSVARTQDSVKKNDVSGLLSVLDDRKNALMPGVKDRAFSSFLGRGMGEAEAAKAGVGDAMAGLTYEFDQQKNTLKGNAEEKYQTDLLSAKAYDEGRIDKVKDRGADMEADYRNRLAAWEAK